MLFAIISRMSSMILKLRTRLVGFFLISFVFWNSLEGTHSSISIMQVCRSRTIVDKHKCVYQTVMYTEQREL